MDTFNWTCPFCNLAQTVVPQRRQTIERAISVGETAEGNISACVHSIGCSNNNCNRVSVKFSVRAYNGTDGYTNFSVDYDADPLFISQVIPQGAAKPQPEYIPKAIVEDYTEACLIRDKSPKAAATLARRCLQGMIRDFCDIKKGRLVDEISKLRSNFEEGKGPAGVTSESIDAIDHVRSIGNIGAHMEKDINLIIPVDTEEAQALIDLIEMLFEDWYVARHVRQERLSKIGSIAAAKKKMSSDLRGGNAVAPPPIKKE